MNLLDRLFKPKPKPEPIEEGRFYVRKSTYFAPRNKIHYEYVVMEVNDGWVRYCVFNRDNNKIFFDRQNILKEYEFREDFKRSEPLCQPVSLS